MYCIKNINLIITLDQEGLRKNLTLYKYNYFHTNKMIEFLEKMTLYIFYILPCLTSVISALK